MIKTKYEMDSNLLNGNLESEYLELSKCYNMYGNPTYVVNIKTYTKEDYLFQVTKNGCYWKLCGDINVYRLGQYINNEIIEYACNSRTKSLKKFIIDIIKIIESYYK